MLHFVTFVLYICLYNNCYCAAVPVIKSNELQNTNIQTSQQIINNNIVDKENEELFQNVPTYMKDLYGILSKEKRPDLMHNGDTITSYFDEESEENEQKEQQRYKFKITDINKEEEHVKTAELHLFKQYRVNKQQSATLNTFIQINVINKHNNKIVSSKIMGVRAHGWIKFPITRIVRRWIRKPQSNKGIEIQIKALYGNGEPVSFGTKNTFRREPMLVVFTKRIKGSNMASLLNPSAKIMDPLGEKKKKRMRRRAISLNAIDSENRREEEQECHLAPLVVDTEHIGLQHKIMSPLTININQCVGTCPFKRDKQSGQTNHGLFQSMAAAAVNHKGYPCCAPASYDMRTFILRDGINVQHIKIVNLDKLIATSCACL